VTEGFFWAGIIRSYVVTPIVNEGKMVLAESKTISFDDFISWLPERSVYRYEELSTAMLLS
jgi:hypothetical protein